MSSIEFETQWIDAGGRPARVEIGGSGPTVLIVGSAVPMAWTRPLARSLISRGHRTVNFDYEPPEGWSGTAIARTCLRQVEDVEKVVAVAEAEHVAVVGVSRGAITAFAFAALHPDVVDQLILGFPLAGFADTLPIEGEEPTSTSDDPIAMLDAALETAFSSEFLAHNRQVARDLFLTDNASVVRVERDQEDTIDDVGTVGAPTLIISGGEDRVVTSEHPERLLREVPHAIVHEFPDASHGFIMEKPDDAAEVIATFLRR